MSDKPRRCKGCPKFLKPGQKVFCSRRCCSKWMGSHQRPFYPPAEQIRPPGGWGISDNKPLEGKELDYQRRATGGRNKR